MDDNHIAEVVIDGFKYTPSDKMPYVADGGKCSKDCHCSPYSMCSVHNICIPVPYDGRKLTAVEVEKELEVSQDNSGNLRRNERKA